MHNLIILQIKCESIFCIHYPESDEPPRSEILYVFEEKLCKDMNLQSCSFLKFLIRNLTTMNFSLFCTLFFTPNFQRFAVQCIFKSVIRAERVQRKKFSCHECSDSFLWWSWRWGYDAWVSWEGQRYFFVAFLFWGDHMGGCGRKAWEQGPGLIGEKT